MTLSIRVVIVDKEGNEHPYSPELLEPSPLADAA